MTTVTNLYQVIPAYLLAVGDRVNLLPVLLGAGDDGTDEWLFDLHQAELELGAIEAVHRGPQRGRLVVTFANFHARCLWYSRQPVPVVVEQ